MPKVIIQNNSIESSIDCEYQTDDVLLCIYEHFDGVFPDNARIYDGQVSQANDITPGAVDTEKDIERIKECCGTIYVVNYPQFFLFGLTGIFGTLLKVVLLGLASILLRPKPQAERNTGNQSPNNGLSERVNSSRIKERIPDIYGRVRSTPDLIMKPYFRFEDQREVEYAYLCVGTGSFQISDVKDDITPIEDISGVSYEVYGPNTSPNSGQPETSYGTAIDRRVWSARKSNAVNGQILRAPNSSNIKGEESIAFNSPDGISSSDSDLNFEEYFEVGDNLIITDSATNGNSLDLDGTYEILSVTNNSIALVNPGTVNSNWDSGTFNTPFTDARLRTTSDKWVGPFIVENSHRALINLIAPNGIYTDDGEDQFILHVGIEVEFQQVNEQGDAFGPVTLNNVYVHGSAELQNSRLRSAEWQFPDQTIAESKSSRWQVRCRRFTDTPDYDDRRVVDEVQWRDLYGLGYVDEAHFGNVTTIHVRTPATQGALSIKQRKFNCDAIRLIDVDGQMVPSQNAGDIIKSIALDPLLGAMTESQIDMDSIDSAISQINETFGTTLASCFGYTFDDNQMSAEEMIKAIAAACFCTAYRQGSLLKLHFEKPTDISSLQFNHRNKIPKTEIKSSQFGTPDNTDGVRLDWTNPEDGALETFEIPADGSALNPRTLEFVGVCSRLQAYFHTWREWNKIQYQNTGVTFDATAEAITLTLNQKVLIADNTRSDTIDGEIHAHNGTELELSQPFEMEDGVSYTIHLQHTDGQIEALPILSAPSQYSVIVGSPPRQDLSVDSHNFAVATYIIEPDSDSRPLAFLIKELEPENAQVVNVSAVNYDPRYYERDSDFIDNVVDENANLI